MRGLLVATLWLASCSPEQAEPPGKAGPPPMKVEEQERGMALCEGYVARLCACADRDTSLQEQCELARAQPEALELPLKMLGGSEGRLNDHERRLTEASARKIIAACVKADGALALDRCPRR